MFWTSKSCNIWIDAVSMALNFGENRWSQLNSGRARLCIDCKGILINKLTIVDHLNWISCKLQFESFAEMLLDLIILKCKAHQSSVIVVLDSVFEFVPVSLENIILLFLLEWLLWNFDLSIPLVLLSVVDNNETVLLEKLNCFIISISYNIPNWQILEWFNASLFHEILHIHTHCILDQLLKHYWPKTLIRQPNKHKVNEKRKPIHYHLPVFPIPF